MPSKRFAAEIARNSLFTNWAAVYLSREEYLEGELTDNKRLLSLWQPFKKLVSPRNVALVSGLAIVAGSLVSQISVPQPANTPTAFRSSVAPSPTQTTKFDAIPRCSEDVLKTTLAADHGNEPEIPKNFSIVERQQFGGALFVELECRESSVDSSFEVQWLLAQGKWQLKQISRLPMGQSGDLANSN